VTPVLINYNIRFRPKTASRTQSISRICGCVAALAVVLAVTIPATEAYGQAGFLTRDHNVSISMSVLDELGLPPTVAGQHLPSRFVTTPPILSPPATPPISRLAGPLANRRLSSALAPRRHVSALPRPLVASPPTVTVRAPASVAPAPTQVEVRTTEPASPEPPTPVPPVPAPPPKAASTEEVAVALASLTSLAQPTDVKKPKGFAITVYAGLLTGNDWQEPLIGESIKFEDSWLIALAGSKELGRVFDHLVIELEGQVVRHLGDQDHWEFNVPIVFRWEKFPWDNVVDTSLAYGVGPSYATKVPPEEVARKGDSQRWLVYWMFEIELGLPQSEKWSAIARIHHRSGAWGVVADEGGSNIWALGLKRRF